jgi:hypothetical protein
MDGRSRHRSWPPSVTAHLGTQEECLVARRVALEGVVAGGNRRRVLVELVVAPIETVKVYGPAGWRTWE